MTIYEELGGAEAVSAAVDLFYQRVLSDRLLSPYFEGVDTAHLRAHQRAFMTAAFDGPQAYSGASMTAAHAGREITKSAFGLVVGHLVATLKELGVSNQLIMRIAAKLGPLEPDIVSMAGAMA